LNLTRQQKETIDEAIELAGTLGMTHDWALQYAADQTDVTVAIVTKYLDDKTEKRSKQ